MLCGYGGGDTQGRDVYNPFTIFLLGLACGALMVLFGMLAAWMRRKEAELSLYKQPGNDYFFGKGMVWAGCVSVGCAVIAVVGSVDSTFALPHVEWPERVLTGAAAPLGLWRLLRGRKAVRHAGR